VITTPARTPARWLAVLGFLIGMAGIAGSITVVFQGMRSVLDVGGQCASGGPYVIAVQCPDGTWTLPLAIFGGLGFAFLAVAGGSKVGGIYGLLPGLAWVGLFCGLGFNFLQWGIAPPVDPADQAGGPGLIFVLLGIMFEVMGIAPVVTTLWSRRPGAPKPSVTFGGKSYDTAGLIQSAEAFEHASKHVLDALHGHFKPEFLNRVDDILIFHPLGKEQLVKIVDLRLEDLRRLLADRKISLELTDAAKELLFTEGYDPNFGARPLKRAIQKLVQDPLAMKILDGEVPHGDHVVVDSDKKTGKLTFKVSERVGENVANARK